MHGWFKTFLDHCTYKTICRNSRKSRTETQLDLHHTVFASPVTRNANSTKKNTYVYSLNTLWKSGEWLTSNSGFPCFRYCKYCDQFFHSQWTCSLCFYHMKRSVYICMGKLHCLSIHFTIYTAYANGACPL